MGVKHLTDFLIDLGIEKVPHSGKTYLAHLVNVHRLMASLGCGEELCAAGMFHSIYGTEQFQGFKLELADREKVRNLIGERAERLAYLNCALDRAFFDQTLDRCAEPYPVRDRIRQETKELIQGDFDDLCRVHLYDWLEQVPRSRLGWNYRRGAYRRMAERLGPIALRAYDETFACEPRNDAQST